MTKLDFTKPLAFASDPHTMFSGPFIGPDEDGDYAAILRGTAHWWKPHGECYNGSDEDNLVPFAEKPKAYLKGVATYYPEHLQEDKWGSIWLNQASAGEVMAGTGAGFTVALIEIAAADALATAIGETIRALHINGQNLPALSKALDSYRKRSA